MSADNLPRVEPMAQHAQSPTAHWAEFQADVSAVATRSADERAQRDRERKDTTRYHRNAETTPTEG